ncbi:XRE family transcriptional regulator [Clostridium sp. AF18-27]|uniref:helix-turn-helix domain-containing protein n=1 Tax=Enterocloster lavalensis TaxID=460384 RepID=UPI000E47FA8D|nr:helix-turn-helix transcriptional regulator [Enterocloster lavalensis]RHR49653.1 XRE family transcriptional regulator [Clostridium sp. AF18-27]
MYQKLCKLMEQRGETAYQVSKATGISQSAFSNWKAGNTKPGTKNLAALAKHFDVPMEYFMVDEPVEQGKGA